jgi:hypothetical protein
MTNAKFFLRCETASSWWAAHHSGPRTHTSGPTSKLEATFAARKPSERPHGRPQLPWQVITELTAKGNENGLVSHVWPPYFDFFLSSAKIRSLEAWSRSLLPAPDESRSRDTSVEGTRKAHTQPTARCRRQKGIL